MQMQNKMLFPASKRNFFAWVWFTVRNMEVNDWGSFRGRIKEPLLKLLCVRECWVCYFSCPTVGSPGSALKSGLGPLSQRCRFSLLPQRNRQAPVREFPPEFCLLPPSASTHPSHGHWSGQHPLQLSWAPQRQAWISWGQPLERVQTVKHKLTFWGG